MYDLVSQIGISNNNENKYKDQLWTIFRSQAVYQTIMDQIDNKINEITKTETDIDDIST